VTAVGELESRHLHRGELALLADLGEREGDPPCCCSSCLSALEQGAVRSLPVCAREERGGGGAAGVAEDKVGGWGGR
jgi:hypothetical protein